MWIKHRIGNYPALIKIYYDNGSFDLTPIAGFDSEEEFLEVLNGVKELYKCNVPVFSKKIIKYEIIKGIDNVKEELRKTEV